MRRRDWLYVMVIIWGTAAVVKIPDLIEVLQDPCVCLPVGTAKGLVLQ